MNYFENYKMAKLRFNPYRIFNIDDRIYLYVINTSGLFEIDSGFLKLLSEEGNTIESVYFSIQDIFSYDEFESILKDMVQARIMYSEVHLIQVEEKNSISALSLMIIQECNMRCKYCYGEDGEFNNRGRMTEDIGFNAIDYLVENTNEQNLAIAFIGGEPLLNFNLIKSVIKYCNELKQKLGINFSYTMTTNGTLLNKEIEDYLIRNNVVTQL